MCLPFLVSLSPIRPLWLGLQRKVSFQTIEFAPSLSSPSQAFPPLHLGLLKVGFTLDAAAHRGILFISIGQVFS